MTTVYAPPLDSTIVGDMQSNLSSALSAALADGSTDHLRSAAAQAVELLVATDDVDKALQFVLENMGPRIYGLVALHSLDSNDRIAARVLNSLQYDKLSANGITLRDLCWPSARYKWEWRDEARIKDGVQIDPPVSFRAAERMAVELGYVNPKYRAILETELANSRSKGFSRNIQVKHGLPQITDKDWLKILVAFQSTDD